MRLTKNNQVYNSMDPLLPYTLAPSICTLMATKKSRIGVSQAAGSIRFFQSNNEVLRGEIKWQFVFMVFLHC